MNAKDWWTTVTNCTKSSTPASNSIAVFSGNSNNTFGHMVYVEKVENGNVYFTEANWSGSTNGVLKSATISQFESRGPGSIYGYLILK